MSHEIEENEGGECVATPEEMAAFIAQYSNLDGGQDLREEHANQHPSHPLTQEQGSFVGYVYKYPLYQTPSGDEFILRRGQAKIVRRFE